MRAVRYRIATVAFLLICFAAMLASGGCNAAEAAKKKPKQKSARKTDEKKPEFKIIAYYFHGNVRCATCKKLEALSEEAVKTGFENEMKSGLIQWRVINVEDKANEHYIEEYKLYSKSLVLAEMSGGKQVKWKNLEKIWELVKDRNAFIAYVQEETRAYLKDAPAGSAKKAEKKESK